jgi:D-alanyl-D-alanine carboxypeptidase
MSQKYSLPHGVSASPLFMRNLVVWGLPLLGWVVLIIAWLAFSSGEASSEKPADPKPEQVEQSGAPVTPAATPSPATAPAAPTPPTPAPSTPAPMPSAPVTPAVPVSTPAVPVSTPEASAPVGLQSAMKLPYDFTSAATQIGHAKEKECNTGILVDPVSRKVLWAKGADRAVPIASMTKMMTMLLIEEAIAQGKITRETIIPVSKAAYEIGGSQVWLDPRESFPLHELLKAVAIKSANDAAYLVGEYLCDGDIDTFVARMNARARELGMNHSSFYDAHGLGDAQKRNNLSSAYDMALLAERLLDYPEVIKMASTRMDSFRNGKTELRNHNNLVFNRVNGVDGLKTGYTKASGFCVTFTCKRNGRRLIGCVTGFKTAKDRDAFCRALLDWGYAKK